MSKTVKCTVSDEMYIRLERLQKSMEIRAMSNTIEMCIKNGVNKLEKSYVGMK